MNGRRAEGSGGGLGLSAWPVGVYVIGHDKVTCRRPGLITSPLVVIPFSVWAWRRLRADGVPIAPADRRLNLALAAVVPLSHAIARLPRLRGGPTALTKLARASRLADPHGWDAAANCAW